MRARGFRTVLALALLLLVQVAAAQSSKKEKEPQLRSVQGLVSDKDDQPLQNAVVFLKNLRTNVVLSHFSDAQGNYRFTGLDPNADYEVFAESGDQKSLSRTVTALDSRKELTLNLKVDRKKG